MIKAALLVSLWLATVGNLALWRALWGMQEVQGWRGLWLCIATAVMIASLLFALLNLLAWRWTFKPVAALCLVSAAAGTYFMLSYGVILDTPMMANILATDVREASDLLGLRLLGAVLVLGVLPALWLWRTPLRYTGFSRQIFRHALAAVSALVLCGVTLMLVFQDFAALHRNHMALRSLINPLSSFYSLAEIATEPLWGKRGPVQAIGLDAKLTSAPFAPYLVLVVGETARAANFGINGYNRDTTPELVKRAANEHLIAHTNAWSCGTSTEASLPCMFSHLDKTRHEASRERFESLLDVLSRAGLAVLWVDNQSGCKGVCDRVPNVTLAGEPLDEAMLKGLEARVAALPAEQRARGVVVVLHQMGSHGPAYYKRSPSHMKPFQPECTNHALASCSRESVVNAYDNSIRYTDYFLARVIDWLKAPNQQTSQTATAMLYVSDHGESLGENNLYLHGLPYAVAPDVQKQVPWITWLSGEYVLSRQINMTCMKQQSTQRLSHDHYFHTVLGLTGVRTSLYQQELDALSACRP